MNDNYLIHYGVLGMKWGIRRYQNKDGTRTSLGKKHERTLNNQSTSNNSSDISKSYKRGRLATTGGGLDGPYSENTLNAIRRGLGDESYAKDTMNNISKKGLDDDYSNETLNSTKPKGLDDDYSNETLRSTSPKGLDKEYSDDWLGVLNNKTGLDERYSDEWLKVLKNAGINNVSTPRELKEKVDKTTMDGKEFVSKALNSNNNKGFSKDSDGNKNNNKNSGFSKDSDGNKNNNNNNNNNKDFETKLGNLNDVYRIVNATSSVFKTAKNLTSNTSNVSNNRKREHVSQRKLSRMSDEELQRAIARTQKENEYLSYANKTTARGKQYSGEILDKLATIASIAGTGVAIYASISSIKNRNQNG